uniref:Uncharacterized protein n=1 Tax=Glycine max TaxID=3847 RepID=C6T5Z3_SOYBN|nr:unknown [Glycine max]
MQPITRDICTFYITYIIHYYFLTNILPKGGCEEENYHQPMMHSPSFYSSQCL